MSFRRGGNSNAGLGLPFGLAYQDITGDHTPSEVPVMPLPVNNPVLTRREKKVALNYISQVNNLKDSAFFTGDLAEKQSSIIVDNSNEIERYGDKYLKRANVSTFAIDEHPFHQDLFPRELYNVMGLNKKKSIKRLKTNSGSATNGADDNLDILGLNEEANGPDGNNNNNNEKLGLSMLEKLKELAEEVGENEGTDKNKEGPEEDIPEDDDFDEDEEDDDDDYNAEKYFNDGDDDDGYGDGEDGYDNDEPAF